MTQKLLVQWRGREPCRVKPPAGTDGKSMGCTERLGVKTSDNKGNTRPVFTILKKCRPVLRQTGLVLPSRLNTENHFRGGGQLSRRCADDCRLTGKLDKLTAAFKASDGKTAGW